MNDTEKRIAAIQERCDKATPGPWEQANKSVRVVGSQLVNSWGNEAPSGWQGGICNCLGAQKYQGGKNHPLNQQAKANAEFIAHARVDVPYLLADNARLTARVEQLEADIAGYREAPAIEYNAQNGITTSGIVKWILCRQH